MATQQAPDTGPVYILAIEVWRLLRLPWAAETSVLQTLAASTSPAPAQRAGDRRHAQGERSQHRPEPGPDSEPASNAWAIHHRSHGSAGYPPCTGKDAAWSWPFGSGHPLTSAWDGRDGETEADGDGGGLCRSRTASSRRMLVTWTPAALGPTKGSRVLLPAAGARRRRRRARHLLRCALDSQSPKASALSGW